MKHILSIFPPKDMLSLSDNDGNTIMHRAVKQESWGCLLEIIRAFGATEEIMGLLNS